MYDPVKVTIGGAEYAVPTELSFAALKRCKPVLAALAKGENDPIDVVEMALEVIAAAYAESDATKTVEFFAPRLKASEVVAVAGCITPIMVESGYWKKPDAKDPKPGEGAPAAENPTST